jgi:hypothetical protein
MTKSLIHRLAVAVGLVLLGVAAEFAAVRFQSGFAWFASFPLFGAGLGTPLRSPWLGAACGVLIFGATVAFAIVSIFTSGLPVD